ncbi:hypothetical protein CMUS01_05235 [Colletotrichum musicola]|uniref:Uncharacterized protein n=1 Tax=Colletotrichum musicola TaxID=2175873 RepID=A0A8H6KU14_9PEZI|nr:hypothetical protein CMUS01_05235 [Colletotrichum musicola]
MSDAFPTPTATPKRKRGEEGGPPSPVYAAAQFSFQLPEAKSDEDGSASPRSKVVHKFRGLALSGPGGGGVAQQQSPNSSQRRQGPYDPTRGAGDDVGHDDDPFASRKRMKVPELEMKDADTEAGAAAAPVVIRDPEVKSDPGVDSNPIVTAPAPAAETTEQIRLTANDAATPAGIPRSHPFVNRVQDSKSRRRRAGTPPLKGRKGKGATGDAHREDEDEEMRIVDPVRAALTWKEEEITVYDPNDKDDDGTGINGVGFMPTAAMAYARTQKRRMQLAEYRKREESEARARRSQRRRGSGAGLGVKIDSKPASGSGDGVRKVRFMESEPNTIVTNG